MSGKPSEVRFRTVDEALGQYQRQFIAILLAGFAGVFLLAIAIILIFEIGEPAERWAQVGRNASIVVLCGILYALLRAGYTHQAGALLLAAVYGIIFLSIAARGSDSPYDPLFMCVPLVATGVLLNTRQFLAVYVVGMTTIAVAVAVQAVPTPEYSRFAVAVSLILILSLIALLAGTVGATFRRLLAQSLEQVASLEQANEDLRVQTESRQQAEKALAISELDTELAIEASGAGTWQWEIATDELKWSPQQHRIYGVDEGAGPKTFAEWLEYVPEEAREIVQTKLINAMTEPGRSAEHVHPIRRPNEETRWLLTIGRVHMDGDGNPVRVSGVAVDMTDRVASEERERDLQSALQEGQRLESLGLLAGGVAHDFNNLLLVMMGNIDLAMTRLDPGDPAIAYLDRTQLSAQHAAELCNELLAYSGKGHFVVQAFRLDELVSEMGRLFEVSVPKKIQLRFEFSDDTPVVEADVSQIRQVVMNLITNASGAIGDETGAITVSTGSIECDSEYLHGQYISGDLEAGTYAYCEISDTGVGMDRRTQEKIFEPFFTTKPEGRGLGMAAVLGIVRGHRGSIRVYSEVGKGTTIKLLLPATESEPIDLSQSVLEQSTLNASGRILFVDDEEAIRNLGERLLQDSGYEVVCAVDGDDAIERFRADAGMWDAVVLDMTMPGRSGAEVFSELARIDDSVPVLLSSGFTESDMTNRLRGKSPAGFLQKPYLPRQLLERVHEIVARDGRSLMG